MAKILMNHSGNRGYGADQVEGMTLAELLEQVQDAILEWGEDAEVVAFQTNNGRGANYGHLHHGYDLFNADECDEEELG